MSKSYILEVKRASPNPNFMGTGNMEVNKSGSHQKSMGVTPVGSDKMIS